MHEAFKVHMLSEEGKAKTKQIAEAFDELLSKLAGIIAEGRELAIVRTKLEEACFFAKKAMARQGP
jgi:hypothetical protein